MRIDWEKRTLDEFGHAGLSELARSYDLLVIDHPMLGEVHRDGTLLDLKPRLTKNVMDALASDALGPCLESYCYDGSLYALPIDAAAPAASYRPDLLERMGVRLPEDWDGLLALARTGVVVMPLFPADLFLNFLGMCASRDGLLVGPDQFLDASVATLCLTELRELALEIGPGTGAMNPIEIYEAMSSGHRFAYCPFAYTYSNYARPGFADHTLHFANPVTLRLGKPLRTILGGTGIAISSQCAEIDAALEFCTFVAGADCQRSIYGMCGGQPASRSAWNDAMLNRVTSGFFQSTMSSMERAHVRPRFPGYIALQGAAGKPIGAFLRREITAARALKQIEELYRLSQSQATGHEELR